MDDQKTTTDVPVDTGAAEAAQPKPAEPTPAAEADVTSDQEQPSEEPSYDEDTLKWMNAKGIDPSSPDAAIKLAKSAREAEKAMHAKAQQASELEKSMAVVSDQFSEDAAQATGNDPDVLKRLNRMEVKNAVRDFFDNNPDARDMEPQMVEVLGNNPHLAGDIEALYAKAMLRNKGSLKSEGGREALESLAGKQQAAVPSGSAVNSSISSSTITRAEIQDRVSKGDVAWYEKNLPKINQLMAEGKLQ